MKKVGFTNEMLNIFSEIIGKDLITIQYDDDGYSRSLGNIAIETDNKIIEISNLEDNNGWDEDYDSSHFECKLVEKYEPIVTRPKITKIEVNNKIEKINIISDHIVINDENIDIIYDMGVEIITTDKKYLISRDYFYSMLITISTDKDLDEIYPIEKVKEDWDSSNTLITREKNKVERKVN